MTVLDQFAMAAMQAVMAEWSDESKIAEVAYDIAEAMLAEGQSMRLRRS